MSVDETEQIVNLASELGMKKIKLTGGEPLLRSDIVDIVAAVADQPIDEISMSTNGTLLADLAGELAEAGLDRVNISLDTLDPETYERITGERILIEALAGVDEALEAGLTPVKLNMVVLAGVNDREVERMISFATECGAILQLIELLRTPTNEQIFALYHRDPSEFERELSRRAVGVQARHMHNRKKYILNGGEVEIVKPMDNTEFCTHCTRLRLTPDGYLKPCLMRNDNLIDVLSPLRAGDLEGARKAFEDAIAHREPYFLRRSKPF